MDTTSPLRSNILTISSSSPSPKAHHAPFSKTATNFIRTRNLITQGTMHSTKSKSSASLAALLDVKQRRKIVESNARLLANRLIALSLEEKKIKSHTQMIHKRSDNLLAHRLNREQMKQERSAIMLTRGYGDKSFEEMRQTVTESKTQHMFELQKIKDSIYEERKKEALDVKNQTIKNHERFLESRQQKIDQLKSVYMKAKQEEANIPATVKQARYDRLEPVRQIKYKIIATEQDKIKYRTKEIKKLDKMEDSMLDLLYKAEKEDIKAVTQYTEISSFAVPDLMEKYKCYLSGTQKTKKFRSTFSHSRTNLTLMKSF